MSSLMSHSSTSTSLQGIRTKRAGRNRASDAQENEKEELESTRKVSALSKFALCVRKPMFLFSSLSPILISAFCERERICCWCVFFCTENCLRRAEKLSARREIIVIYCSIIWAEFQTMFVFVGARNNVWTICLNSLIS